MDLIIFERKAFEEFATKIEQFILRVSNSPVVKNGKKKTNNWLDHQDVCQRLKISKRTLQTLRDNGTLAYTKIGNLTIVSTNYRKFSIVCQKTEQPYQTMMSIYATRRWRICLKSAEGH